MPVPPYRPALSDDYGEPVQVLSHRGSHSGGGETPVKRFARNGAFLQSQKVVDLRLDHIFRLGLSILPGITIDNHYWSHESFYTDIPHHSSAVADGNPQKII